MRRLALVIGVVALSGCATTSSIQNKAPSETYVSQRSREVVSDCLLNRFITDTLGGKIDRGTDANVVTIYNPMGGAMLSFTIRDNGSGSVTEMRRSTKLGNGRNTTKTCM